jgi:hypothetical protein
MRRALAITALLGAAALAVSCTTAGQTAPTPEAQAKPVEQAVVRAAPAAQASAATAEADTYAGMNNLALGRPTRSNNHIYEFTAPKATDGEILTYWEGAAKAYPDEISVDLGGERSIKAIRLKLNPKKIWQARKQTLEVLTSSDGAAYVQAMAPKAYQWDPDSGNEVTIPIEAKASFVKLSFTANEGSTGAQLAELEIYGE